MNRFVLLPSLVVFTSGCTLTLPVGVDYSGSRQAPYVEADKTAGAGGLGLDADAKRCADRINSLRFKAGGERAGSTVLSLVGGSVSLSSGVVSAFVEDENAKKATAITAAVGGVVALIVPVVGNAAQTVNQMRESLNMWNKADVRMVSARQLPEAEKRAALIDVKRDLQTCAN
ncbi:hypothetical protein WME99_06660 [Sorangium sp. So ce136]|uniref:hypothetical protein n=1 Tax=Sorangium sp. So ce136 TaxID=3133284 RepID=UPI003F0287E2